tara:strand:- start:293 stop:472 length:180 start_codon:yes stop_codon:yes gene_type:complete
MRLSQEVLQDLYFNETIKSCLAYVKQTTGKSMSIPTLYALFDKLGIERKSMRWQQCEIV